MSIGPTNQALARMKRASRGRPREDEDGPLVPRGDPAVFGAVLNVSLLGVVALAAFAHLAGVSR